MGTEGVGGRKWAAFFSPLSRIELTKLVASVCKRPPSSQGSKSRVRISRRGWWFIGLLAAESTSTRQAGLNRH